MTKANDFSIYLVDKYYDKIFYEVRNQIDGLDFRGASRIVPDPEEVTLDDITAKFVHIKTVQGNYIAFELVVSADIVLREISFRNNESDECEQWLTLHCTGELDENFTKFKINEIELYSGSKAKTNVTTSSFVPIISKDNLESKATEILQALQPQMLATTKKIDIVALLNTLGLKKIEKCLSKTGNVFGKIYFRDSKTLIFNDRTGCYEEIEVQKGTIVVDPKVFFLGNVGSINNTVVHECVHWYLHKKYFEFLALFNDEISNLTCSKEENYQQNKRGSEKDFSYMEWHANALAPRIMMPYQQYKDKAKELLEAKGYDGEDIHIIKEVIEELAVYFEVSRQAAKIRMIDIGHEKARGVFNFIDGGYAPTYKSKTKLNNKESFAIPIKEFAIQLLVNEDLNKEIIRGKYLYVDNVCCLNDSKYIEYKCGSPTLTEYAKNNIDECCIIFNVERVDNTSFGKPYSECALYRNMSEKQLEQYSYCQDRNVALAAIQPAQMKKSIAETKKILEEVPNSFIKLLKFHMKRTGTTTEKLAEKSQIGTRTIDRLRGEDGYHIKVNTMTIVALCVGLRLPPELSSHFLEVASVKLSNTEDEIALKFILTTHYQNSIFECNEALASMGIKQFKLEK